MKWLMHEVPSDWNEEAILKHLINFKGILRWFINHFIWIIREKFNQNSFAYVLYPNALGVKIRAMWIKHTF